MFVRIHALKNLLDKHENVLVYGTGKCANIFYEACTKIRCISKIASFVTTFKQESDGLFHGIPVIRINEVDVNKMIFIATGHEIGKEIESLLIQLGARNIVCMEDYLRGEFLDSIRDWLEGKNFKGYCEEIAEWYVYEHPEDIVNYDYVVKHLIKLGEERTNKAFPGNNLVFVAEHIRARHVKIIRELMEHGYEISVLQRSGRSAPYVSEDDINRLKINIIKCYSIEEILYYALQVKANLFYVDDLLGYGFSNLASYMIRHKKYLGKIIFDPYDIRHGAYINQSPLAYTSERYSFEHADGVISRYLNQPKYLKENFHFGIKTPFLEFMDYCEPSNSFKDVKIVDEETLRICWCVSHANELLERDVGNTQYKHPVPIREWLSYVGKRTDYLVDIYVWEASEKQKELFKIIEKECDAIHFFTKTPHSKFINCLQSYDYGMSLCVNKKIPKWPKAVEGYSENSWINSMYNIYFDFLSSGVPIIGDSPITVCKFFSERYGCLVEMSAKDFDMDYLKKHRQHYKQKALEARQSLAIDKHIDKLMDFLECVRGV